MTQLNKQQRCSKQQTETHKQPISVRSLAAHLTEVWTLCALSLTGPGPQQVGLASVFSQAVMLTTSSCHRARGQQHRGQPVPHGARVQIRAATP